MRIMFKTCLMFPIAILFIVVSTFASDLTTSTLDELVQNKNRRAETLSKLIQVNRISGLPSEFVIVDSSRITCSQIVDNKTETFTLAAVNYDVHMKGSGSRNYIFIFDSSGKCLFHSPDRTPSLVNDNLPYDMYFCDMTGDGSIEKLVTLNLYEVGKTTDSSLPLRNALQVWRISSEGSLLLFEVHYSRFIRGEFEKFIRPSLSWPVSKGDPSVIQVGMGIPSIQLGEVTKCPLVVFKWSHSKKSFEWHPKSSKNWKVIFPKAQPSSSLERLRLAVGERMR